MSVNPVKRKLAAILAADAVGYSRLMAADEEGTMKILSAHRSMIDGIIEFHEGRIINTAGDSVLAEFASPTQAVRCAVEIQDALKTRNDALPEFRRMLFRIGVNLGDVMVKGDDLLGDGVNVAARLESVAEPGQINISSSVYDQIAGKLDLGFVDLGEQSLKNIDRPVRAYRVERGGGRTPAAQRPARRGAGQWIAVASAIFGLGAGGAWFLAQRSAGNDDRELKAQAQAEIAKARAEADEARRAADEARRALEEQRVAQTRARAQAELSAARAEAEATRRKADAELAAASATRRAAQAAAKPGPAAPAAPPPVAKWVGAFACAAFGDSPPAAYPVTMSGSGNAYAFMLGASGKPGFLHMKGARQADGTLILSGDGISRMPGGPYPAKIDGRFEGERFRGRGLLGTRDCALVLATGAAAARDEAARAALPGEWAGTFACAAAGETPPSTFFAGVLSTGAKFDLRQGKSGEPGSMQLAGSRETSGRMRMTGEGLSGLPHVLGQRFRAEFDGRFAGERYAARGKLGSRDCALHIARKQR